MKVHGACPSALVQVSQQQRIGKLQTSQHLPLIIPDITCSQAKENLTRTQRLTLVDSLQGGGKTPSTPKQSQNAIVRSDLLRLLHKIDYAFQPSCGPLFAKNLLGSGGALCQESSNTDRRSA